MKNSVIAVGALFGAMMLAGCNPNGLSVEVTGGGVVMSDDGTIDCPSECSRPTNASGETITLGAKPTDGFKFDGWGGGCSGHEDTCVIEVTNAVPAYVTATFVPVVSSVNELPLADDFLRQCVSQNYASSTAVESVIELNCNTAPIRSLTGIHYLTNLRALRLQGSNEIEDVTPLTSLPHFAVLSLSESSEKLVHIRVLVGITSFRELYIENAPLLDCADVVAVRSKIGSENVILGPSMCNL